MNLLRPVCVLLLVSALSGCGFHLRSAVALPPDLGPVAVTATDPYSPLADALGRSLELAGATPAAADALDGATRLEILSEKWADLPISVDTFGRAQEYSLRYAVVFRLRKADGAELVPQQAVELSRDYIAPPADAIGRNSERELLVKEMRRDMSASILRRIEATLRAPAAASAP